MPARRRALGAGDRRVRLCLEHCRSSPKSWRRWPPPARARSISAFGTLVERIEINMTDPDPALPATSARPPAHPHPFLTDIERASRRCRWPSTARSWSRPAMARPGRPTCNLVPAPDGLCLDEQRLVHDAGHGRRPRSCWTKPAGRSGADGVRDKDGKQLLDPLPDLDQLGAPGVQALIKQWWNEIGVEVELQQHRRVGVLRRRSGLARHVPEVLCRRRDVRQQLRRHRPGDVSRRVDRATKAPSPETSGRARTCSRFCDAAYDALVAELGQTAGRRGRAARSPRSSTT